MSSPLEDLIDAATSALQHFDVERLEALQLRAANFSSLLAGTVGIEETQARQRVFAGLLRATEENLAFLHQVRSREVTAWAR